MAVDSLQLMASGLDGGPWGESHDAGHDADVNAETMRKLAESTFQGTTTYKGEMSAAAYLQAT